MTFQFFHSKGKIVQRLKIALSWKTPSRSSLYYTISHVTTKTLLSVSSIVFSQIYWPVRVSSCKTADLNKNFAYWLALTNLMIYSAVQCLQFLPLPLPEHKWCWSELHIHLGGKSRLILCCRLVLLLGTFQLHPLSSIHLWEEYWKYIHTQFGLQLWMNGMADGTCE